MKKIIISILAISAILFCFVFIGCSDSNNGGNTEDFSFTLINNGSQYAVEKYTGDKALVVIPSTYRGKSVTQVKENAFNGSDKLLRLDIPSTITSFDGNSVYNCANLQTVNYLGTVDQWTQIEFDSKYSNPTYHTKNLYINGELLTEVNINFAQDIRDFAFVNCESIRTLSLSSLVNEVGKYAFSCCVSLESVQIANATTKIKVGAFDGCSSIIEVNFLGSLSEWAKIEFESEHANPTYYAKGLHINGELLTSGSLENVTKINDYLFAGCSSLENMGIPEGVTEIGTGAFYECSSLTNVEFPSTLKVINRNAFYKCRSIVSIVIPDGVTSIDDNSFKDCLKLASVEIPDSVVRVGENAFTGCSMKLYTTDGSLKYVKNKDNPYFILLCLTDNKWSKYIINENTKFICDYAFRNCNFLKNITIPSGVIFLGKDLFYNCGALNVVEIPNSVKIIDEGLLFNCGNIKELTLPFIGQTADNPSEKGLQYLFGENRIPNTIEKFSITGKTKVNDSIFKDYTHLKSVEIGSEVTAIGDSAFRGCTFMESITFGENSQLTEIGDYAFSGCKIFSVKMPSTVTTIGNYAFAMCSELYTLKLSNNLTSIGSNAFAGCLSLRKIVIPACVANIDSEAFSSCRNLKNIYCQAESKPEGWEYDWKGNCSATVTWGYTE